MEYMYEAGLGGDAAGLLTRLDEVLAELGGLDLSAGSDEELIDLLTGVERRVRRFAAVDHALIAETDERGLGLQRGCANTTAFLSRLLGVGVGQARARVRAAQHLAPRRTLTGEVLAAEFPATAAAQAEGAITLEHARVITATVKALPAQVREESSSRSRPSWPAMPAGSVWISSGCWPATWVMCWTRTGRCAMPSTATGSGPQHQTTRGRVRDRVVRGDRRVRRSPTDPARQVRRPPPRSRRRRKTPAPPGNGATTGCWTR